MRVSYKGAVRIRKDVDKEWSAPVMLWLITLTLIFARQGMALVLVFPVLSVLIGIWMYFKHPMRYIGYVWSLWLLSPEIRRLADWLTGVYAPASPIQIAPLVVTMISGLSLIRFHGVLAQRRGLPIVLMTGGLVYAFMVGVVRSGPLAVIYDLANWIYPIFIGFHILVYSNRYVEHREQVIRTFTWGMLITGIYGVVQFCIAPPWDAFWMLNAKMNSIGEPVPFSIRVFSTMNSPGPLAFVLMGAMIYITASNEWSRWIAGTAGIVSFSLTLVRSAWGGWVVALVVILTRADYKTRMRIIAGAVALSILSIPFLMIGPVAEKMQARIQTFSNLQDDQSYSARNDFYAAFASMAFFNVAGEGMGATGTSTKLSNDTGQLGQYGSFDSGVMNIPFVLGWPGTLLYLSGFACLMLRAALSSFRLPDDAFASANLSIVIAVVSMLVFTNSLTGTSGLLLYGSIFSILSGADWKRHVGAAGQTS